MNSRYLVILACLMGSQTDRIQAQTAEKLFLSANVTAGKELHIKNQCATCHIQKLGGDGSAIYTRLNRLVTNPQKLVTQVGLCNTRLNAALFPEDELDIAAFLNRDYYKFK